LNWITSWNYCTRTYLLVSFTVSQDKQLSTNHTYKTKDRVTRTPLETGGELRYSGRVSSSCSTSDTRRVNLVTHPVMLWTRKGPGSVYDKWNISVLIYFTRKEMISIFPLWTSHSYVAIFQQHLHMEYISLSRYDIPEFFVVPIRISLIEGCCQQGSHWTKGSS
jgi:hypothetical protein